MNFNCLINSFRSQRSWLLLLLAMLVGGSTGCQKKLNENYGNSAGRDGRESIAGFGIMRQYFHERGWDARTVVRLSERLYSTDAIVFTPSVTTPPSLQATQWIDDWLADGDKTFIYVLRDYQTVDRYWQTAKQLAPPPQRLEYRRRSARARMEMQTLLLGRPTQISNGWFTAVALNPPPLAKGLTYPSQDGEPDHAQSIPFHNPLPIEYRIRPYDSTIDQITTTPQFTPGAFFQFQETGYSSVDTNASVVIRSEDGLPIVTRLTSNEWPNSQILVVSGSSLLTNFGLVEPAARQVLADLEALAYPVNPDDDLRVGFLYSDESGIRISSTNPDSYSNAGMEAFTTWPLNVISIHFAILGLVVCLMLFPILGRPRRIQSRTQSDFADHISAVAGLMAKTNGEQYARVRISEYMVRVRGETTGPWIIENKPVEKSELATDEQTPSTNQPPTT